MRKIRHILFPVDFSNKAHAAAPFVAATARHFGALVTMLAVVQPVILTDLDLSLAAFADPEETRVAAEAQLQEFSVTSFQNVDLQWRAVLGSPADEIKTYADDHTVGLVMMTTHGHSRFQQLLLGSVSAQVLHDVCTPVWTDAHLEETDGYYRHKPRTILCAAGDSKGAAAVMAWAEDYAQSWAAQIDFVDSEPEAVCARADRMGADLLVIARSRVEGASGRLCHEASTMIRSAPCPVISI